MLLLFIYLLLLGSLSQPSDLSPLLQRHQRSSSAGKSHDSHMTFTCTCTCTCTLGCRTGTRISVSGVSSDHEIISLESTGSEGGVAGGGASPGNTVRPQNISLSSLLESVLLALEEPKGI